MKRPNKIDKINLNLDSTVNFKFTILLIIFNKNNFKPQIFHPISMLITTIIIYYDNQYESYYPDKHRNYYTVNS